MVNHIKNWWKYSSLRFYILNALWNYKFWIFSKKKYRNVTFQKRTLSNVKPQEVSKKRFYGYEYNGETYLDNPGIRNIERDVWESWKRRGLI